MEKIWQVQQEGAKKIIEHEVIALEKTNVFHNVFKVWMKCGNTMENCGSRVQQFFPFSTIWNSS